jgi:uracil-DNA glycosylase family 4
MLIGEAPGYWEDRAGRPFVGPAGRELDRFLAWEGIERASLRVTNLVKCRPPNNADPTALEIAQWSAELRAEITTTSPRIIGALGRFAAWWVLTESGVPQAKLPDMETMHGIPIRVKLPYLPDVVLLPVTHPAAGLHQPSLLGHTQHDIKQLARVIAGEINPRLGWVQYSPALTTCTDMLPKLPLPESGARLAVAIDTEGSATEPWSLSFALQSGAGYCIRARAIALDGFRAWLGVAKPLVVLHNALHDLAVLRGMGIDLESLGCPFIDTMVMAYNLRVEPQGLKQLAWRHLGLHMRSYPELIAPAEDAHVRRYLSHILADPNSECPRCYGSGEMLKALKTKMRLTRCLDCAGTGLAFPLPEPELVWRKGAWHEYNPQPIARRIRELYRAALEGASGISERWHSITEHLRAPVEAQHGTVPKATLDDIDPLEAERYSALDAAVTMSVYHTLTEEIASEGLGEIVAMDTAILPIVDRMQATGMAVDLTRLAELSTDLASRMASAEVSLEHFAGRYVNPASGDQVAKLLFDDLGCKVERALKAADRPSTDSRTLEALKLRYADDPRILAVLEAILAYRQASKLRGTYAIGLRELARWSSRWQSWRVHSQIKTTRTDTGRLSSAHVNLQNIPARSEEGKKIRQCFIASPGMELGSWDYDQIEMRVLASESQDANLLRVFRDGIDIHTLTASLVFRVPMPDVTKNQRSSAKCVHPDSVVWGNELLTSMATLAGRPVPENVFTELPPFYLKNERGGPVRATHVFNGGEKPLVSVITKQGLLVCSKEHRFSLTDGRLVRSIELERGDVLAAVPETSMLPDNAGYDLVPVRVSAYAPVTYIQPTDAMAYFAGLFVGDGARITTRHTCLSHGELGKSDASGLPYSEWQDVLVASCEAVGLPVIRKNRSAALDHRHTHAWLAALSLVNATGKCLRVPTWVLHAGRTAILQFLAGLFDTGGTVGASSRLFFTTKDAVLAGQVAYVLRVLGAQVHVEPCYNRSYSHYYYRVALLAGSGMLLAPYMRHQGKVAKLRPVKQQRPRHGLEPDAVVAVLEYGLGPCVDVTVDSEEHLYALQGYAVHNSIGFGVVYGVSAKGLREQMELRGQRWSEAECQQLIDAYLKTAYPGVGVYMDEKQSEARRTGAVRDMFGRARYLAGAGSGDDKIRAEALRQAGNMPIQSAAAGIMKRAMIDVWRKALPQLWERGVRIEPLMSIHDELVFEFETGAGPLVASHIEDAMANAVAGNGVSFTASGKWGSNWGDLK